MLRLTERATVTVSCQFTAPVSGRYGFWIGGTGEIALQLNGERVATFNGEALEGDIMGKLMQAPHTRLEFPLQAGENLTFRAEMALGSSIAHGIWFGCQPPQTIDLLQQAVDHARAADSVVLVIGETADAGLESIDRDATALPAHQVALIRACLLYTSKRPQDPGMATQILRLDIHQRRKPLAQRQIARVQLLDQLLPFGVQLLHHLHHDGDKQIFFTPNRFGKVAAIRHCLPLS